MAEDGKSIDVEIVYALPEEQWGMKLQVRPGTSLGEAVRFSGILQRFPEIDLSRRKLGIFGKPVTLDHVLEEGDRVEIYRPLTADPKEARRRRAEHKD
jgi:uncharacterized protein